MTVIASFLNWGKIFYSAVFFYTFCANAFFLVRPLSRSLFLSFANIRFAAPIPEIRLATRLVEFILGRDHLAFPALETGSVLVCDRDGADLVHGVVGEGVEE